MFYALLKRERLFVYCLLGIRQFDTQQGGENNM